jgi:hypothetical protein
MSSSLISRIVRLGAHALEAAALVVTFLGIGVSGAHVVSAIADRPLRDVQSEYGQLPLSFVANAGQTDPSVRFQVRGSGGALSFEAEGVTLSLPAAKTWAEAPGLKAEGTPGESPLALAAGAQLTLKFVDSNPTTALAGADQLPGSHLIHWG